jgi:hypothetical protein
MACPLSENQFSILKKNLDLGHDITTYVLNPSRTWVSIAINNKTTLRQIAAMLSVSDENALFFATGWQDMYLGTPFTDLDKTFADYNSVTCIVLDKRNMDAAASDAYKVLKTQLGTYYDMPDIV